MMHGFQRRVSAWRTDGSLYSELRTVLFTLLLLVGLLSSLVAHAADNGLRGTGDLAIVVERANGSLQIVDTSSNTSIGVVDGLGDLSHASAVYSRDGRYAYVFGRDGGLSKVDLLTATLVARTVQAGNSIGGAISQDGRLVAVSNYEPGGVKIFDAGTLELFAEIPAEYAPGLRSKVIGLVDAPGQRFVFSLWESGEIWLVDAHDPRAPQIQKYPDVGRNPYDALITPDGRYYIAGLFGEDGMALLDLWYPERGVQRVLADYGKGNAKLPVYKMPHLEGWAVAGTRAFVPAVGRHEVLVIDMQSWQQVGRIPVHGQPVFVMARPDGRQVWVNFAMPDNDTVQVIDVPTGEVVKTLTPGPGVLHMEFEPRGEEVWVSVRDADQLHVYATDTFERQATLPAAKPSGIFMTARAARIGL